MDKTKKAVELKYCQKCKSWFPPEGIVVIVNSHYRCLKCVEIVKAEKEAAKRERRKLLKEKEER